MREQRIDRLLVAENDVEHAIGKDRFLKQFSETQRRSSIAFVGLLYEGVAAAERNREHPHWNHLRKVERRPAESNANRHTNRPAVDVRSDHTAMTSFQLMRHTGGNFPYFHAPRHRT